MCLVPCKYLTSPCAALTGISSPPCTKGDLLKSPPLLQHHAGLKTACHMKSPLIGRCPTTALSNQPAKPIRLFVAIAYRSWTLLFLSWLPGRKSRNSIHSSSIFVSKFNNREIWHLTFREIKYSRNLVIIRFSSEQNGDGYYMQDF